MEGGGFLHLGPKFGTQCIDLMLDTVTLNLLVCFRFINSPTDGGPMRHDWIFDVLKDLRSFAQRNGLPALAAQVETAMRVAHAEIGDGESVPLAIDVDAQDGMPPAGRPH